MSLPFIKIVSATEKDIGDLHHLVEMCYRGELSKSGWTTEADMLKGPRVTISMLQEDMLNPTVSIFKAITSPENSDNMFPSEKLVGCVRSEVHGDKLHLGMFCVHPSIQNLGLGRKLVHTVEEFAKTSGYSAVELDVILQRTQLLAWYERQGFKRTGETVPVLGLDRGCKPTRDLNVIVLRKNV